MNKGNFHILLYFSLSLGLVLCSGCKKYLDEKPNKNLTVPSSFKDLQALLDQNSVFNIYQLDAGDGSCDDYYLTTEIWNSLSLEGDRQSYIWGDEIFYGATNQWFLLYQQVYYANLVLEFSDKLNDGNEEMRNKLKAQALFQRARAFLTLVTTWAKAYDMATAHTDLGIPLRLVSDFNLPSSRASVEQSYKQILDDIERSITLFPATNETAFRANKFAAFALQARTYLNMGDYEKALKSSLNCLEGKSSLINFNELDPSSPYPIPRLNNEVLYSYTGGWGTLYDFAAKIDTILLSMYDSNDLRKVIFYNKLDDGSYTYRGSYDGGVDLFMGLALDEIYLIKSECLVRLNKVEDGLVTLSQLLVNRYKTGTYHPKSGLSKIEALREIFRERRKELLMRDVRWQDLKRLNRDVNFQSTLKRILGNKTYELKPGDPRYALPIPKVVINNSNLQQNPR